MADTSCKTIIVEHRERLARFGVEYIEAALFANNRKLIVLDNTEIEDDLVRDTIDILTSFCARLYGKRSAKRKASAGIKAIEEA